jgi:DNA-binding CsgD family transcriptional regulator
MADAQTALDAARYGWDVALPAAHGMLARALMERDELDAAARALDVGPAAERWVNSTSYPYFVKSQAELRLRRDDPEAALELLLDCGRRLEAANCSNPAVIPWRSQAALAALRLDRRDQAGELVREEIRLAEAFGAPRAVGMALRAGGIVEGGEEGLRLLSQAVDILERSHARLEHARALVDLGEAIRRSGQRVASRDPLRQGLDIAHRCGATALSEYARGQLAAAGARPRRLVLLGLDALTSGERRAAELAAQGMTNREIAEALFVTVKTVEWHLGNAYTKLGISSRRKLAEALRKARERAA